MENVADSAVDASAWFNLDANARVIEIPRTFGNPLLARGAFGELSIAIDTDQRWKLAVIKTICQATVSGGRKSSQRKLSKEVLNEILALRLLSPHENIVPFLGLCQTADSMPGSVSLVFRYSPIDLYMLLQTRKRHLSWSVIKTMARDIFDALHHAHSNGILHRDVTPQNLLLSSAGRIQLCDFGLAKPCPSIETSNLVSRADCLPALRPAASGTKGICSLHYRAPEVLLGGHAHHPSVDIYSAGLVLSELISFRTLFDGRSVVEQLGQIFSVLGTPTDTNWPDARTFPDYGKVYFTSSSPQPLYRSIPRVVECPNAENVITLSVALDPNRRLSARDIRQRDWWTTPPMPASYGAVAAECIVDDLREPITLFSVTDADEDTVATAREEALKVSATRRSYGGVAPIRANASPLSMHDFLKMV